MKSTFIDSQLVRLKEVLRVSEDQEVAEVLGMSKAAFSAQKKRGSFPEKELRALAQQRPELGIDVEYVLTGGRLPAHERRALEGARDFTQALHMPEEDKQRIQGLADAALLAQAQHNVQESARAPAMAPAIPTSGEGGGVPDWSAYIQVPHYEVRASAGNGSVVHEENVVDHLVFKRDWIVRSMGLDPRRLALIDVRGDSMAPTINDGDLILLDTREAQQTEGIYAINLAGGLLVKRLRLRLSGAVEVISDNERYGTETISGDQLAQLHIVGRVVWQGRRI